MLLPAYRGLMRAHPLWALLSVLGLVLAASVAHADAPRRPEPTVPAEPAPAPVAPVEAPAPLDVTPAPTVDYAPPSDATYTAPPVADEEAVIVSFTTPTPFSSPLVTIVDHTGEELDCVLPCTVRTRVGHLSLHGARLNAGVDLDPAGLTYEVALGEGPSGDDLAVGTALALSGGLVLGLSIWAFTIPDPGDTVMGFAVIGAIYGGLAFLFATPYTIALLANVNGGASLTGFRVGLVTSVQLTGNGLRIDF